MPEKEKKNNTGKGILIGLILLLLIFNGVQFYLNHQKEKKQQAEIEMQAATIDSVSTEVNEQLSHINSLLAEMKAAKEEATRLGLDMGDLEEQITVLKNEKDHYLRNYINPSVRKEMQTKISNYEVILSQKNEQIRQLKARNDSLFKETIVLKDTINTLGDSISLLDQENNNQAEELRKGRVLKVQNFEIHGIKKPEKGKYVYDYEHVYKNKEMVQTKIDFEIGSNPIALIGEKEIYIQIISPDRDVIHDMSQGGGKFMVKDTEKIYSIKQNIMYDRKTQPISLIFNRPADYEEGEYIIQIWCEDEVIGKGDFSIE